MDQKLPPTDDDTFGHLKIALKSLDSIKAEVVSGSMLPLIQIGESIQVEALREEPKTFDIVVFRNHQKILVVHYLWTITFDFRNPKNKLYITRSLAGGEDFPIPEAEILGRVTSHRLKWWMKLKIILKVFWSRRVRA